MSSPPRVAGTSAPAPGRSHPSSGRGRCPPRRRGSVAAPHCRTHRTGAGDCPLYQGDRATRLRQARRSHRPHLRARAHRPRFAPGPARSAESPGRIHPRATLTGNGHRKSPARKTPGRTTRPGVQAAVVVTGRRIRKHGRGATRISRPRTSPARTSPAHPGARMREFPGLATRHRLGPLEAGRYSLGRCGNPLATP
jgi:hypothetical protein